MKIVFLKKDFNKLRENITFDDKGERFAYVLCNYSYAFGVKKLIANKIIIPEIKDYISRSFGHYRVKNEFTNRIYNKAIDDQAHVVRVHSHPPDILEFSGIDRITEMNFAKELFNKVEGMEYASIVFSNDLKNIDSWEYDKEKRDFERIDKIIVIGEKGSEFYFPGNSNSCILNSSRDYLAFGEKGLSIFKKLDVGLVGVSGTGSIVGEQLIRLGIRRLIMVDYDRIEESNLNRLQGVTKADIGKYKVDFYYEYFKKINPEVEIVPLAFNFYDMEVQKIISCMDVIISCVDSGVRLSINNISNAYLIPYFDLGTGIKVKDNKIEYVGGQVFNVIPGTNVCLNCGTNFKNMFYEYLKRKDLKERINQGYINAPIQNPNVYFLNTIISGMGMWEFIKYVLNFNERYYFKIYYDGIKYSVVPTLSSKGCIVCRDYLGKGNKAPFLVPQDYLEKDGNEIPDIEKEIEVNVDQNILN